MKFSIDKSELIDKLLIASKAIASKTTMSILECILFRFTSESVVLFSNDMEMGIITSAININILDFGDNCDQSQEYISSIALEAKILQEIIRKMPDGEINIEYGKDFRVIISKDKTSFNLSGFNGEQFPEIPTVEKDYCYKIPANEISKMIKQTLFAVSTDDARPIFTGELLDIKQKSFNVIAVDGYRIAMQEYVFPENYNSENPIDEHRAIVPGKTLGELSKLIQNSSDDEELEIYISENNILFQTSEFTFVSRLLVGEFLKYEQSFSTEVKTSIKIENKELLKSVECAYLLSREQKRHPIVFNITDNTISISTNSDINEFHDEMNVDIDGEDITLRFDPKNLIEILRVIGDDEIKLEFMGPVSPCIIKSTSYNEADNVNNEEAVLNYKFLVLPLRNE